MDGMFPKNFMWGAGTASHQVEGNTTNQWSVWEAANAQRLAKSGGINMPEMFPKLIDIREQAHDPANYISGAGIDHYSLYETDFDILLKLNLDTFRFSVEWSRIEPTEGKWDEKEIAHYQSYVKALKKRGIRPMLTLWHWTMPLWFTDKGGFEKKENIKYFVDFATKIVNELDVEHIIILNEPNSYTSLSYQQGAWPPERKNPALAFKVYYNLTLAHKQAFSAIKQIRPESKIGIAANMIDARALSPSNPLNRSLVWLGNYITNWWFLNRISNTLDFIGVNYYFTTYHNWRLQMKNPKEPLSDLGWYMEPSSLKSVLSETYKRYKKPLIVTENGLADEDDKYRKWWLEQTLQAMSEALSEGVDLQGYLHWSLIDNFEWAYGWWPKFGLVSVDRKTMKRTIRPSAKWFAKQIASFKGKPKES